MALKTSAVVGVRGMSVLYSYMGIFQVRTLSLSRLRHSPVRRTPGWQ